MMMHPFLLVVAWVAAARGVGSDDARVLPSFARELASSCTEDAFPRRLDGVQCDGLTAGSPNATKVREQRGSLALA